MNTALTRRESLWADEPVMRDGRALDHALSALEWATHVQDELHGAIKGSSPQWWLCDAEKYAIHLLEDIRSMRAVLK